MKSWRDFKVFIVVDYEFQGGDGDPQKPICYVAKNAITGSTFKHWITGNEKKPIYPTDKNTLLITYFASAELGCHLALNFKNPLYILDLYSEFRCLTNGSHVPSGYSLLGACDYFGIKHSDVTYKKSMRNRILQDIPFSNKEKKDILEYCQQDVELTNLLFQKMKPLIDLNYALLRGRYMSAVASMEYNGIPVDVKKLDEIKECWQILQEELIWRVDKNYNVFDGTTFKIEKFKNYLKNNNISWELTPSGLPKTDINYMRKQAKVYPQLKALVELRHALGQLRLNDLTIGNDGRNRCLISPFRSKTSRNQPSTSKFIFGPSTWLRFLIKPKPNTAIAYVDYCQQEIAIAAILSDDDNLLNDYKTGDPYLAFAKKAGAIPPDGTRESHKEIRDIYKQCMLALNYGMSIETFANNVKISYAEAYYIVKWHKRRYRKYWEWNKNFIDLGMLSGVVKTNFNWYFLTKNAKYRTLQNWAMQAHGADILRLACILCVENNIKVIAPIHDAILIEASIKDIDNHVKKTQEIMEFAAKCVIDFPIKTDVQVFKHPNNFYDPRGEIMWNSIWEILNNIDPIEKKNRLLQKYQKDLNLDIWEPQLVRRDDLSFTENKTLNRIKEKTNFTDLELKYLIQEARDSDFDLEEEIDWDYSSYSDAKNTIQKAIDPMKKKTIKELMWETGSYE